MDFVIAILLLWLLLWTVISIIVSQSVSNFWILFGGIMFGFAPIILYFTLGYQMPKTKYKQAMELAQLGEEMDAPELKYWLERVASDMGRQPNSLDLNAIGCWQIIKYQLKEAFDGLDGYFPEETKKFPRLKIWAAHVRGNAFGRKDLWHVLDLKTGRYIFSVDGLAGPEVAWDRITREMEKTENGNIPLDVLKNVNQLMASGNPIFGMPVATVAENKNKE